MGCGNSLGPYPLDLDPPVATSQPPAATAEYGAGAAVKNLTDEEALRALRAASPALRRVIGDTLLKWTGDDPSKWIGVTWGDGRVRELKLEDCSLKELPAELGQLTALIRLELGNCRQLMALPAELGQLTSLTTLNLNHCTRLTALPAELGQLTGLTTLNLERCEQLTALPAELGQLTGLTTLNLNHCEQLTALPAELGQLTALTTLDLMGCEQLTALPAELGQLTALTALDLIGCEQLTALPAELGQLTSLTALDLYGCTQLTALPAELGQLTGLTTLILFGCKQLTALPAELGQLTGLTTLDLRGCEQLTLPSGANKESTNAPPTIAAYARLLIVEPRKETPEQLHAFLLDKPAAVPAFFKSILTDPAHADWLGDAVGATPGLARLTDADGRRAIDVAHSACKQAMQAALYLLSSFDVDAGPPLHFSATAAVVAATEHESATAAAASSSTAASPSSSKRRRALKAMREAEQVLAELRGRAGLESAYVVSVGRVYMDSRWASDNPSLSADLKAASTALGVEVERVEDLPTQLAAVLDTRGGLSSPSEEDHHAGTRERRASEAKRLGLHGYRFLVVLELADRSLSTTLIHDHVAGNDNAIFKVRSIAADLARALGHLHKHGRIHADLKPLNAVRVDSRWQLIDLDVSCAVGDGFGEKVPSSGYCPPEMAKVLLDATDKETGKVDRSKLGGYKASVAFDLWSFGVVLFHLIFGRSLWHTDQADNVKPKDLAVLVNGSRLREMLVVELYVSDRDSSDLKGAVNLLHKLLEPEPAARLAHFKGGRRQPMEIVLDHPFFLGQRLSAASLEKLLKGQEEMKAKLDVVIKMSEEQRGELLYSRKVLIKAAYESNEVMWPSTFVMLEAKLPSEEEEQALLALKMNDDGTGFEVSGQLADAPEKVKEQFDKAKTWLDRVKTFGKGVIEGDAETVFGKVKEALGDLVTEKTMYFYLVDELTGKPVRGAGYPIEITTPSEIVPKLFPVMQVGMRAMSLYNGVAGVAQMFGCPVPKVPKAWREGAQSSVEMLKQESSVEAFGTVHAAVQEGGEKQETTRGASLRELQRFFKEHDKDQSYAGLRRVGGEDGTAVWTLLKETEVATQLEKRARERREEEQRHEKIFSDLASAPSEATDAALGEVETLRAELKAAREKGKEAPAVAAAADGAPIDEATLDAKLDAKLAANNALLIEQLRRLLPGSVLQ